MQRQKYQAYTTATHTVASTRQIVMLYDGAIRFMQQAKEAMVTKRIEERYHLLMKTSDIISGLQLSLDFEKGGEIARVLYDFYASLDRSIFSLHHSKSVEGCDHVISELKKMRDSWDEIDRNLSEKNNALPHPSATASPPYASQQSVILSA